MVDTVPTPVICATSIAAALITRFSPEPGLRLSSCYSPWGARDPCWRASVLGDLWIAGTPCAGMVDDISREERELRC